MDRLENIVAKREIAHYEQIPFWPQCFQKSSAAEASESIWIFILTSQHTFVLLKIKIDFFSPQLSLVFIYQTFTNQYYIYVSCQKTLHQTSIIYVLPKYTSPWSTNHYYIYVSCLRTLHHDQQTSTIYMFLA